MIGYVSSPLAFITLAILIFGNEDIVDSLLKLFVDDEADREHDGEQAEKHDHADRDSLIVVGVGDGEGFFLFLFECDLIRFLLLGDHDFFDYTCLIQTREGNPTYAGKGSIT